MKTGLDKNSLLLPPVYAPATPSLPEPGNFKFFVDSAGNPFMLDSDGTATPVGGDAIKLDTTVIGVPTQYATVGEAVAGITDASPTKRYTILVSPGIYAENNPIQLKSWITIIAVGGLGTVDLQAQNPNQDMFLGVNGAHLYGVSISDVSGASNWAVRMDQAGNMIMDNVNISDCSNGILLNNVGGALTLSDIVAVALTGTIGTLIENQAGNLTATNINVASTSTIATAVSATGSTAFTTIDIFHSFSSNLGTALSFDDSSQSFVRNVSVVNATTGVFAQNGANVRLGNSGIFQCTTGVSVPDVGSATTVGLSACTINSNTTDIAIDSATAVVFGSLSTNFTNTSINQSASVYLSLLDLFPGDEGLNVIGELHVGRPERPAESTFGGGDSYTRNMQVYTYDGTVYTDVSSAASSPSGSTVTFPNTNINTAIYISSALQNGGDFLKIPGFKMLIDLAYTAPANPFVIEYWDGTAVSWVDLEFMVTESGGKYNPLAKEIFNDTGSFQVRFNAFLANEFDWQKNDDPGIGTDYFWIRIRINNTLTVSPAIQQFKLHSDRTEINEDGYIEMFGIGRPIGRLPWDAGLLEAAAASPGNQDLYLSDNVDVGRVENLFTNGATDRIGFLSSLPQDLDTSTPIKLRWSIFTDDNSAGNIDWVIRWAYTSDTETAVFPSQATAPATSPNELSVSFSATAPATANTQVWYETEIDISTMVSRREGGNPDVLWLTIQRTSGDTHGGNVALVSINANYLKWCLGGHY